MLHKFFDFSVLNLIIFITKLLLKYKMSHIFCLIPLVTFARGVMDTSHKMP